MRQVYPNELYHYGVLGMKWGVRRYRNEDGSYTKAGRKRYGMDLDVNDKSRKNIAKIRLGEARRRLDVAKSNNGGTNYNRMAQLTQRERAAKRAVKESKRIDKGAYLTAKGQTIGGNKTKATIGWGAAYLGSKGVTAFMQSRLNKVIAAGKYTPGHKQLAQMLSDIGGYSLYGIALAYDMKKGADNRNIRAYQNASRSGRSTEKHLGSDEYKAVVERSKKGKKK